MKIPSFPDDHPLRKKIEKLPQSPGVYLMKDGQGVVIYVGKALSLKNRVSSYFNGGDGRAQLRYLMAEIADLEFSLAATEREALILEDTLIKKFRPKYNIRLRDDKTYLSIRIKRNEPFPRIELIRRQVQDGARYFGPFSSTASVRRTVDFVNRHFPLRTCEDTELKNRTRPCLQYQIKRCAAPCVGYITPEQYKGLVDQVALVLEGKDQELLETLKVQMGLAAERMDFEAAAELRDRLRALESVATQQQVVSASSIDRDIIGFYRDADDVALAVIPVRQGRMQDNRTFVFSSQVAENPEILSTFITQLYGEGDYIPREILLPFDLQERDALEDILRERAGRKVSMPVPQRGEKTRLVELAEQTAKAVLTQELDQTRRAERAGKELQKILSLPRAPRSFECFDISNTLGRRAVASKVRFQDAVPFKDGYRRYRIKTLEERPNDYGMMREVLDRRLRRGIEEGDFPDVLVVDGGKGQLGVALAVLKELGITDLPVMGFAKPDSPDARSRAPILIDKIFLPGRKNPIVLPPYSPALRMLQALRDESHRFAITYHRNLRGKATVRSLLEDIPGVGEKRRKLLLKTFGSVKRLKEADEQSIGQLEGIGPALASQIVAYLKADSARPLPPPLSVDSPDEDLDEDLEDLEAEEDDPVGLDEDDFASDDGFSEPPASELVSERDLEELERLERQIEVELESNARKPDPFPV